MSGKHEPTWPKLACTRCGGDIWVELIDEGTRYEFQWLISCEKCGAEWDKNGEPRAVEWLADLEA